MMEYHLELKENQRHQEASEVNYSQSHKAFQSTKLGDKFKLERNYTSSADSHHTVEKNADNISQKSKAFHQKHQPRSKADELVRYMSNLPSFLERGENLEEKAFNVGVLEWRRLEKWQYNHSYIPPPRQSCKSSPSNSNASSFSSTEGSSSNSGRDHSCSPAWQRMHHSSMEPNRSSSPTRVSPRSIKSFERNGRKFQDLAANSSNYVRVSQSILSTHKCFNKYTDNQAKECKTKDRDPLHISEKRESQTENFGVISCSKGKMKLHDCEPLEVKEKLESPYHNDITDHCMEGRQPLELLKPKHGLEVASPTKESDLIGKNWQGTMETSRQSFSDIDAHELFSDTSHSCPFPREANTFISAQIVQPSCPATKLIRSSEPQPYSGKFLASPSRDGNVEGKKLIKTINSPETPNMKMVTEEDCKVRSPSPIRRLVARIGRSSNAKETSYVPQSNSDTDNFRSGGAETAVSSVDSSCEKSNANGKGRSSPLRRLLDPLLKPRSSNCGNSTSSAQRDASSMDVACKLSKGQGECAARPSVKVKLDLGSCKTINVDHPQNIGKCGPLMIQALFQVAVKNGLPLFTFAVDNSSDILAATMRKLSSGKKDGNRWIYTFFTIHEMKKKSGSWLNHGNKDRSHGYIPNVVAQMKVSDVASTDLIRMNSRDQCTIREFVLIATKKSHGDEQTSDLHANEELSATVLQLPNTHIRNLTESDQKLCKVEELSKVKVKGLSQAVCSICESMHLKGGGSSDRNLNPFGLAVILPNGDHGLPSEGEPSTLLERWRSGGSCDCGGWDLGCGLKVLATQHTRASVSTKAQFSTGKVQLYQQDQGLDRKPIFSLSPFKDGIYSVDFDSSLKLLHAFSICIAVLNGLQPVKFSEMGNCFEMKSSEETTLSEADGPSSNEDQEKHPAS